MTTNITPSDTFLGWPATKLKTMLGSWLKGTCDPHQLSKLKALNFTTGACAAFIGECFEGGFITVGPDTFDGDSRDHGSLRQILKLSDDGRAIAAASARKRSSKARAAGALETLVTNAEHLARDKKAPVEVDEIWVFGSFIDEAKVDVGDLDVVVTTRNKPHFKRMEWEERIDHLLQHYAHLLPNSVSYHDVDEAWEKRMIFGSRRDPLVSPNNMLNLVGMNRPCRLVYHAGRGGRIVPENHSHHPNSTGRADYMKDRLVMPELGGVSDEFNFIPAAVYMWPKEIAAGSPSVLGERTLPADDLRRLADYPLDGNAGFAVVVNDPSGRAVFHVSRTAALEHEHWSYKLSLEAVTLPRGFNPSRWHLKEAVEMIGGLFNGDILRLADRREKLGVFPGIVADLEFCPRCAKMDNLIDQMQSATCEPWSSQKGETLPKSYCYGIELAWGGEIQFGYLGPQDFDEEDWSDTYVARSDYEAWALANRVDMSATGARPGA